MSGNYLNTFKPLLLALDAELEDGRIYSPAIRGELHTKSITLLSGELIFCFLWFDVESEKVTKVFTGFGGDGIKPRNSCSAEEFITGKKPTKDTFEKAGILASKDLNLEGNDSEELCQFFSGIPHE